MTGAANDSPINIRNEEMAKNERRIFVKVRKVNREKVLEKVEKVQPGLPR